MGGLRGSVVVGEAVGGGIFAKTAKTPPLQSALRGMALPDLYARAGIYRNGVKER